MARKFNNGDGVIKSSDRRNKKSNLSTAAGHEAPAYRPPSRTINRPQVGQAGAATINVC